MGENRAVGSRECRRRRPAMAPTKPSQSRELKLGSFSQNDFRQTGSCPQSLPPRLVWRCARSGLTPQTAAGGSTSPDAKSICAINSAGRRADPQHPFLGSCSFLVRLITRQYGNGGVALADVSMSNRYGGPRGGWTSIVQPPFGAYATLGVHEVGRDLLLVHHYHRGGMERGWRSVVG